MSKEKQKVSLHDILSVTTGCILLFNTHTATSFIPLGNEPLYSCIISIGKCTVKTLQNPYWSVFAIVIGNLLKSQYRLLWA